MKGSLVPILQAACVALAASCSTAPSGSPPQDSTKFTVENTDRFAVLDAATDAVVSCTGLQERMLADGRMEVVANLRNGDTKPVRIQVQCVFLDDHAVPVGAEPAWQTLSIDGASTEVVRFTAPTLAAHKYSIRARRAH